MGPSPVEDQGPYLSVEMHKVIARAISRRITEGLRQKDHCSARSAPSWPLAQGSRDRDRSLRPPSPGTSLANEESIWGEEEQGEQDLLEEEGLVPDKPAFTGLFKPTLFKSILHKAKAFTRMGTLTPVE